MATTDRIDPAQFARDIAAGGQQADLALYRAAQLAAARTCRDRDLRDDVGQQVWLHLHALLPRLDPTRGAWTFCWKAATREAWRVASSLSADRGRGAATDDPQPDIADDAPQPLDQIIAREAVEPLTRSRRYRGLVRAAADRANFSQGGRLVRSRACPGKSKREAAALLADARNAVTHRRPPGQSYPARPVTAVAADGSVTHHESYREAVRDLKLDPRHASKVLNGERDRHRGYRLTWADAGPDAPASATSPHRGP